MPRQDRNKFTFWFGNIILGQVSLSWWGSHRLDWSLHSFILSFFFLIFCCYWSKNKTSIQFIKIGGTYWFINFILFVCLLSFQFLKCKSAVIGVPMCSGFLKEFSEGSCQLKLVFFFGILGDWVLALKMMECADVGCVGWLVFFLLFFFIGGVYFVVGAEGEEEEKTLDFWFVIVCMAY